MKKLASIIYWQSMETGKILENFGFKDDKEFKDLFLFLDSILKLDFKKLIHDLQKIIIDKFQLKDYED